MKNEEILRQEFNQARVVQRATLEKKIDALMQLQSAQNRDQEDLSIESMRYAYACHLWETAYRKECRILKQYNEAMAEELKKQDRLQALVMGHRFCVVGGGY